MRFRSVVAMVAMTVLAVGTSRADFKYTQQSKVTGGALAGVTKTLGVFSKSARQANEPQISTTMVHGNRLRTEHSTGTVEIIDLDGRRFIHVDTVKKTYFVQTFDQFKQQMEQAKEKMQAEQAKAAAKHGDPQTMTMVPKFDMQATGAIAPGAEPSREGSEDAGGSAVQVDRSEDGSGSGEIECVDLDDFGRVVRHRAGIRRVAEVLREDGEGTELAAGFDGDGESADERGGGGVQEERRQDGGHAALQYTSFGMAANGQGQGGDAQQQQARNSLRHRTTTARLPALRARSPRGWAGSSRRSNSSRLTAPPTRTRRAIRTIRHRLQRYPVP